MKEILAKEDDFYKIIPKSQKHNSSITTVFNETIKSLSMGMKSRNQCFTLHINHQTDINI